MANHGVAPYPVVQQPGQHTTVVIAGAGTDTRPLRAWSTGMCGCFEDMSSCLLVCFCPECYGYHLSSKAGESCFLPCLLPGWLLPLRAHFRGKHNIQGSIIDDCTSVSCCYPCAMCQLSREIDNINKGMAPRSL